ncbi:YqkE family protein [Paenibacillus mesotrionivorans]|uniref:YqkE family protein n=1 Tax=Paenibacillus mesotrionivorans TaxID=3160968 RepID=A0ACC7NQ11_9BACL
MVKKRNAQNAAKSNERSDAPATLKDLLDAGTLSKLKAQAEEMKAEEEKRRLEQKEREEAARAAEKKRLENDFEHLLNNSKLDWRKHK